MLRSRRLAKTDIPAGNRSIGRSLVLYWLCMALAMLAAALLLLSVTGVLSRTARQFGETAALQQNNNAALFTAQMDALSAQGIELSETVSGELERFLASRTVSGGRLVLRCGVRAGIIYVDTLPLRPDRLLHKAHTADNARGTLILLLIF